MFRNIRRLALYAGAVLAVVIAFALAMALDGSWRPMKLSWPQMSQKNQPQAALPDLPQVEVNLPGRVDFGFRTGQLIAVEINVQMPADFTLETDINCTGDMKIVGRSVASRLEKDGTKRHKLLLNLQSLMLRGHGALPPQNAWVAYVTLMYRPGQAKPQALKIEPIIIFPCKTYDDRKSKHAFDPDLDWMPYRVTKTALMLVFGSTGVVWCLAYLWRQRSRAAPVALSPLPVRPVDGFTLLHQGYIALRTSITNRISEQAFSEVNSTLAVDRVDWLTFNHMRRSLARQVRQFYAVPNTMTWQEVSRRGQALDNAIATILGACEESEERLFSQSIALEHYLNAEAELPHLEEAYATLSAARVQELKAIKQAACKVKLLS